MKLKVNKFLKIEILKSHPKSTAHEFWGEQPENLHFNKCLAQVIFDPQNSLGGRYFPYFVNEKTKAQKNKV